MLKAHGFRITGAPDLELGLPRQPLDYNYCTDDSESRGRPLVFFILGWGMRRQTPYIRDKLLPWLVDQGYDVVVADHHSLSVKAPLGGEIFAPGGWHTAMQQRFGAEMPEDLPAALRWLYQQGITELPADLPLISGDGVDYQSFGLMAAMDYSVIYGDLLARDLPFDRKRVIAIGSSNGGYIASLMLKFLPNSLSVVIENSAFVIARREDLNYYQSGKRHQTRLSDALTVNLVEWSPWELNTPDSPRYFGASHACIRDLRHLEHYETMQTKLISYHCSVDDMISPSLKQEFWSAIDSKLALSKRLINEDTLDGEVFKTMQHGMNVSLRGLFRVGSSAADDIPQIEANDFQRATTRSLIAGDMCYCAQMSTSGTIKFTRNTH